MSDDLKQKTIKSLIWSSIDKVGFQFIAFVIGVLTARLLSPKDFGLIGALTVFTILGNALVESGFTAALVRRKNNTNAEYTATFYFNLILSVVLYYTLYFCAPFIASYFRMPELCQLSRFLFLTIILNSFGLIQNVILTKNLQFRTLTRVNLLSISIAGICTICLIVFSDLSYWALAWQQVIQVTLKSLFLWIFSTWRTSRICDFKIIKELFSFSFILLLTSIMTTVIKYIYNIIIGRVYSVQDLGHYSQAYKYQQIPSSIITSSLTAVAYPVLSKLNCEPERQLLYFRKMIRLTACLTFPIMLGLIAIANDFVELLLTAKWLPIVPYFKILLLAGVCYPFHALALNILTVKGHPKKNFILELIRNALIVLSVLLFNKNISSMLIGFLISTFLSIAIDMFFIKKEMRYNIAHQLKDIAPYLAVSVFMFSIILLIGNLQMKPYFTVSLQIAVGSIFYFSILKVLGSKILQDMQDIFKRQ